MFTSLSPGTVWEFITERWTTTVDPAPESVLIVTAVVVVLAAVPPIWRIARQASTIVHEMGHVAAAVLSGRRVSGIALHSDTSGVTVSRGKPRGPGMLFTALAGYPAPGLLGAAMALLLVTGHGGAALTVYQVVMVLALLLSRNVVGILSCLASVLITGVVWWVNDPQVVGLTVTALAVFYALAGVRGVFDVIRVHTAAVGARRPGATSRAQSTDAAQAARAWRVLPLPAFIWLGFFLLLSLASAAVTVWLLL
ncbi:M50 family metallopeptidase [Nesterenkonia alba]|uniref:M50 family metallopeptidase n=1 Tax=Nesterenkonia alba TaxID=515814 RepID=UPI0003B529CA|nr:M50 family metallopeptidase [Nesterenkonia alba]